MARKKDSVALFEVISKTKQQSAQDTLGVPSWMGGDKRESGAAGQESTDQPKQVRRQSVAPQPSGREPILSTADGRLRLSLDYVTGTVIVVAVVLLIAAAFALGRKTAGSTAPVKSAVMDAPFRPDVLEGVGNATAAVQKPLRETGKWYLVIQGFRGASPDDWKEARRIAAFCSENGEYADVMTFNNRRTGKQFLAVWSLKGFDSQSSDAVREHARIITNELGRRYFKKYRTSNFKQNNPEKPWLIQYK